MTRNKKFKYFLIQKHYVITTYIFVYFFIFELYTESDAHRHKNITPNNFLYSYEDLPFSLKKLMAGLLL